MPKYRNCDICGELYEDKYNSCKPELCTPCWYIPDHIPTSQFDRVYKGRYEKHNKIKNERGGVNIV